MKFINIRDKVIKPKLIDMLGKTLAEDIYTTAQFATASTNDDRQKLRIFIDKICSDPRFIGMWGTAQADKQSREWFELLS